MYSSDDPGSTPILTIIPTNNCSESIADHHDQLLFIYMNESMGNWTHIAIERDGSPLPSETGILQCSRGGAMDLGAVRGGPARGGPCNLVMRFVPRPQVRRAALRAEAQYRRWRRGLAPAERRRLPRRRPNLLFVMVDSLSQAQVVWPRTGRPGPG